MILQEIDEILEAEGYDCSQLSERELEDLQSDFENEMEEFIRTYVDENKKVIAFEFSGRKYLIKKKVVVDG